MIKQVIYSIFAIAFTMLVFNAEAQETPAAHLAIKNPAVLNTVEINKVYSELKERMASGYELAKLPIIKNYQSWKQYNSQPYVSAIHGQRYVNNFANKLATNYGKLKKVAPIRPAPFLPKIQSPSPNRRKYIPVPCLLWRNWLRVKARVPATGAM